MLPKLPDISRHSSLLDLPPCDPQPTTASAAFGSWSSTTILRRWSEGHQAPCLGLPNGRRYCGWLACHSRPCLSVDFHPWFIHDCHPALLPACHEVDPCRVRADVAASCDRSRRRSNCAGPASTTTKPSSQATRSTERGGREARSDVLLDWLWPEMMALSGEG